MDLKKHLFPFILFVVLAPNLSGQTSLMSFNVRYSTSSDGMNWWEFRKEEVLKAIRYYEPGIMGTQEILYPMIEYLDTNLSDYSYVGVGRDDGNQAGEYCAIFYNRRQFDLRETRTWWLSETPSEISVGWDASMERIVTYAHFWDKRSRKDIFVFNAHFDHIGEEAREKSAQLILKLINELNLSRKRLVLMGDLNCDPDSEPIALLTTTLDDSRAVCTKPPFGPKGTYNGFRTTGEIWMRIDYIMVRNLNVNSYRAIDDRRDNNMMLSDHFPILVEVL